MSEEYTRFGQEAVFGNDQVQWILYRTRRCDYGMDWKPTRAKLRPVALCRTRARLLRMAGEKGLELSPEGRAHLEALPCTFGGQLALEKGAAARKIMANLF